MLPGCFLRAPWPGLQQEHVSQEVGSLALYVAAFSIQYPVGRFPGQPTKASLILQCH